MIHSLKNINNKILHLTPFAKQVSLVKNTRYYVYDDDFPKMYFFKWTKQQKKYIYHDKPVPKMRANFYDTLYLPIYNKSALFNILRDFLEDQEVFVSQQKCAMLLYNFAKNDLLIPRAMQKLEKFAYKHKGQYNARSSFGGLYAAISHNNQRLTDFFLAQFQANGHGQLPNQCFQILIALNKNKSMTLQQKHQFWEAHFKQTFMKAFPHAKQRKIGLVFKMFDTFSKFEYWDEQIWEKILSLMENKKGWIRTKIIQKIYPLAGTFPRAKQIFDQYYIQLSTNQNILWRYNLEELRLYTSEQMIAKSQQNIKLSRQTISAFPTLRQARKKNARYLEWLQKGQVIGEDEIIKDKAQSFAYAIKDRFEALKADGVDFGSLGKEQFEDLFGQYDQQFMKEKQEEKFIQQGEQQQQGYQQEQQQQKVEKKKKKK